MIYADFEYYSNTFQGTAIKESDFPTLAREASLFIDRLTFHHIPVDQPPPDAVSMAVCAVAERIQAAQKSGAFDVSAGIKSESTDGYSVTYNLPSDIRAELYDNYADAASAYLLHTGLMDRRLC